MIYKTKYWNPKYFLSFRWKFDDFFIHFDRGDKKTEGKKVFSFRVYTKVEFYEKKMGF